LLSYNNIYPYPQPPGDHEKAIHPGTCRGFLGIITAILIIFSATTNDYTLSGVQAALFSSLGIMGAAISRTETRFAGWMLLSSAVWITLSVPIAGTVDLLILYTPAIVLYLVAAILCFAEPEVIEESRTGVNTE